MSAADNTGALVAPLATAGTYKQQRDELLAFIKNAQVSSGVCCCGDEMATHASPTSCDHSPVDLWDHAVVRLTERYAAFDAGYGQTSLENFLDKITDRTRALDAALNGLPSNKSLADLVAQVEAQSAVSIVNMSDGMRVNFRAPDGRRATLRLDVLFDDLRDVLPDLVPIFRDAVTAYPVVGDPLPEVGDDGDR